MNREEITKFLCDLLIQQRLSGRGKYWASEVTLDYGQGKGKQKRVDFMQFKPQNQLAVSGLEKGEFIICLGGKTHTFKCGMKASNFLKKCSYKY